MSQAEQADIVICGAGIAGVAAAYFLSAHHGVKNVILVDERPPLTLTSDKSSEGYRNWWPGPGDAMVRLMNRSIDLLEGLAGESDNRFHMNRRGYVYLTADPSTLINLSAEAEAISELGAGPVRRDQPYEPSPAVGYHGQPTGADLVLDPAQIQAIFPFITPDAVALLHARRCGWLSAQQLGMYLLEKARESGAQLLNGRVTGIQTKKNRVTSVSVQNGQKETIINTGIFVNAAGPLLKQTGRLLAVDLPVLNELHGKIAFEDPHGVVPRDVPMIIWNDSITLPWSDEERAELESDAETAWLLRPLPAGLHFRPEGGPGSQTLLALWSYHIDSFETPVWPLHFEAEFVEIVLRGLSYMVPGLAVYLERLIKPVIDGGYYCKTRENRPLISPLDVEGGYVFGALSGYGIMAALAGGELLAAHILGTKLPDYAPAFHLNRYQDPAYLTLLKHWKPLAGQL